MQVTVCFVCVCWINELMDTDDRYCLSMNVIGFVYSAFQAYDVAYYLGTGKHVINHHLRRPFDFFMDQAIVLTFIYTISFPSVLVLLLLMLI